MTQVLFKIKVVFLNGESEIFRFTTNPKCKAAHNKYKKLIGKTVKSVTYL